jgi:hypothetical protein
MKAGVKGTPYAIEDVLSGSATPDMLQSAKSQMKRFGPGAAVPEELSPHVQLIESQGLSVNGITPVARLPKNMQGRGAMFWFTDPQTGSTLAMFENDMTAESIAKHIADSRQGFPK